MVTALASDQTPFEGARLNSAWSKLYALALPDRPEWQLRESWICRFHHLVASALGERGVDSHVVLCGEEKKLGEVLCFLHQTPGDLLVAGSKVAGLGHADPGIPAGHGRRAGRVFYWFLKFVAIGPAVKLVIRPQAEGTDGSCFGTPRVTVSARLCLSDRSS